MMAIPILNIIVPLPTSIINSLPRSDTGWRSLSPSVVKVTTEKYRHLNGTVNLFAVLPSY